MMIQAILANPNSPDGGSTTVTLPIPDNKYESVLESLSLLGIGHVYARDCYVVKMQGDAGALKCLAGHNVNLDELDYLAKRIYSFDDTEFAQFNALVDSRKVTDITDMINLSFYSSGVPIITSFNDLERTRRRLLLTQGPCSIPEMKKVDFRAYTENYIKQHQGTLTPYGIIFDSNLELGDPYNGRDFPFYDYKASASVFEVSGCDESGDKNATWLYLPSSPAQISRTLARSGIESITKVELYSVDTGLMDELLNLLTLEKESIETLNKLCKSISELPPGDSDLIRAIVERCEPESAAQMVKLIDAKDDFTLIPDVHDEEEYAHYLIYDSGRFDLDMDLEDYFDFNQFGADKAAEHLAVFSSYGCLTYEGIPDISELMQTENVEPQLGYGEMQ